MLIQVNSDNNIQGREELVSYLNSMLHDELKRFEERITRIEVHLSDENSHKSAGDDKRCLMEARMNGLQPIAVTNFSGSIHEAIQGAKDKLIRKIDHELGRMNDRNGRGKVNLV